jgi:hypothetical protein
VGAADPRWREPTSLLPLHWGTYIERYIAAIILIVGGAIEVQGSNTWTPALVYIGIAAHVTGWAIIPARGWRRLVVIPPATLQICLLLIGPLAVWMLVIPFLCWLIVRHRPWRSYVTVLLPLASGVILPNFFVEYSGMLPALAISMSVFVSAAWMARTLATTVPIPSKVMDSSR